MTAIGQYQEIPRSQVTQVNLLYDVGQQPDCVY